ncbi:MAG: alpha/beta fold hydrolase [Myxococcota bacterium]
MPTQRTFSVAGRSVHCVIDGEGPPLLLLHGWPTHSGLYRNISPALRARRTTIAVDLPGFGQSDKPTDIHYGFGFFNEIIDGVLSELGVEGVGLVVHDLGGPVGLHWAVENRDRITELAILNTLVFGDFHWAVKAFMASISIPGVSHALTSSHGIRASMRLGMSKRPTPEALELYTAPFRSRADRSALARAGRGLGLKKFGRIADGLREIKVPTLLLYGAKDRILPDVARTMDRLASMWPHAQKLELAGVGHFLQEDAPELVAGHLERFVRGER